MSMSKEEFLKLGELTAHYKAVNTHFAKQQVEIEAIKKRAKRRLQSDIDNLRSLHKSGVKAQINDMKIHYRWLGGQAILKHRREIRRLEKDPVAIGAFVMSLEP